MVEQLEKKIMSLLEQRNELLDTLQTQNDFKIHNYKEVLTLSPLKENTLKEIVANYYVNLLLLSKKTRQAEKAAESEYFLTYQDREGEPEKEDYLGEIIVNLQSMNESLKQLCNEKDLIMI